MGFQQRKKDYLQRLIEEFFAKLQVLINDGKSMDKPEIEKLLVESFNFFENNFNVKQTDTAEVVCNKVPDFDLLEQYAKLLLTEYQLLEEDGNSESLLKALDIIRYVIDGDSTYSWDRMVLEKDIERLLLESNI